MPAIRSKLESAWRRTSSIITASPKSARLRSKRMAQLVVLEDRYIAEVIDPATLQPASEGELVLTNLGRVDSPLVRYRTGDLVRREDNRLVGGILGRVDDMIHVRGNNVYPSAIEAIIRRHPEIGEFRVEIDASKPLTELAIAIETIDAGTASRLTKAIQDELLFRAAVVVVPPGSLPRSEMKSKRFIRKEN